MVGVSRVVRVLLGVRVCGATAVVVAAGRVCLCARLEETEEEEEKGIKAACEEKQ